MVFMLVGLISMAWSHPFESQFVGHKSTLEIYPTHVQLEFDLEIPLPLVERAYQQSGQLDKNQWLGEWLRDQQDEIEQNLWLEINTVRQSGWTDTVHDVPMWKEESRFLVFTAKFQHESMDEIQSILLLDQVFIGEPSVYWLDIQLAREIVILATDTIEVDGDRYKTHLKRWEMEESRREVRLAMNRSAWSRLNAWWQETILDQAPQQTMKEAFLPADTWRAWTLGKTPLWLGLCSVLLGVFSGVKGTFKVTASVWAAAAIMSFVPVIPVNLRVTLIALFGLGLIHKHWRFSFLGVMLVLICHPSWPLIVATLMGVGLKMFVSDIK